MTDGEAGAPSGGRRVVVFGATGNIGSALIRALVASDDITAVVGVARRLPGEVMLRIDPKVTWVAADIAHDPLDMVQHADAVVHLAWKIQPSRQEAVLLQTNVNGTRRIIEAAVTHRVPALVYASSVGAYSPAPKDRRTDEQWPVRGVPSSTYSRHKALVESMLDTAERDHPGLRIVRMRTSLVFQRSAASEVHRIFMGRLLPWHLPKPLRFVPNLRELRFQATHADDVADAYLRAITHDVSGAFNIAAEPALSPDVIAEAVGGHTIPLPAGLVRFAAAAAFAARLQPSEPGWLDVALQTPVMETRRARDELGWRPKHTSSDALIELLDGIGAGAGDSSAPLHPRGAPVPEPRLGVASSG